MFPAAPQPEPSQPQLNPNPKPRGPGPGPGPNPNTNTNRSRYPSPSPNPSPSSNRAAFTSTLALPSTLALASTPISTLPSLHLHLHHHPHHRSAAPWDPPQPSLAPPSLHWSTALRGRSIVEVSMSVGAAHLSKDRRPTVLARIDTQTHIQTLLRFSYRTADCTAPRFPKQQVRSERKEAEAKEEEAA